MVALGNSEPAIVELAARWIGRLTDRPLKGGLQYHADQDPDQLRAFWANRLGWNEQAISLQRKSNSNQLKKRTWRSRYGVLTVCVNDTLLRARVEAWMDCLKAGWLDSRSRGV